MLDSLYVKNLALIDKAEVCFTKGLNVLSGETGAGKSIIIGSVLIALGAKVPKDIIRSNESEAYIELVFSPTHPSVLEKLKALDIIPEEGQLIISKRITPTKSISKINGETFPASKVRQVAALLLDVHGQHDHQTLLQPNRQLEIVDRNYASVIHTVKKQVSQCYRQWKDLQDRLESYQVDEDERLRRMDILQYELEELEEANIQPGEEERLTQEWKLLSAREKISLAYEEITGMLGYDSGACDLLGKAQHALKEIGEMEETAAELLAQLADAESILHDAFRQAEERLQDINEEDKNPAQIEERLDVIRHLMQKYRCDEAGLLQLMKEKEDQLEKYRHFAEQKQRLEEDSAKAYEQLVQKAAVLTGCRAESAQKLSGQLKAAMVDLNFLDVRFEIHIEEMPQIGPGGRDSVQFYIATNPGEPLKPLAAVASGGELSRIMLAIKSVLAENEEIETLIFDEIDTGISGRTAQKVADRLSITSRASQVICISHLAQIVSMADTHFLIEKDAAMDVTTTHISCLSSEESIRELARLLGGAEITQSVLDTAREMKDMANRTKEY